MADDREREQLRQAKGLDHESLVAIYDEYHEPLYRYVYRQVDDVETSRDLVSEVFSSLLRALQDGRGPDRSVKSWLYRSAHNAVIDHYRSRRIRRHLPLDEQMIAGGEDPAGAAENNLTAKMVRSALIHLSPDQQQVVALKFLAGFNNQEVAVILDKPVGAVKSLQFRALSALRRRLNPAQEKAQKWPHH